MFSGDGGEISDIGDEDLDAGAGDGAIDQMIMPIVAAIRWQFICQKMTVITMMIIDSILSISSTIICNPFYLGLL